MPVAELCLAAGAPIDFKNRMGRTPLHISCEVGHLPMVRFLVKRGGSLREATLGGRRPIHLAARNGHTAIIEFLLASGVSIHETTDDEFGEGVLMWAAKGGHIPAVELCLSRGAKIDAENKMGFTPLVAASYHGNLPVVKVLLQRGADISKGDRFGALEYAAAEGHLDVVEELLQAGANPKRKCNGKLAAQRAADRGHVAVAERLQGWSAEDRLAALEKREQFWRRKALEAEERSKYVVKVEQQAEKKEILMEREKKGRKSEAWENNNLIISMEALQGA